MGGDKRSVDRTPRLPGGLGARRCGACPLRRMHRLLLHPGIVVDEKRDSKRLATC